MTVIIEYSYLREKTSMNGEGCRLEVAVKARVVVKPKFGTHTMKRSFKTGVDGDRTLGELSRWNLQLSTSYRRERIAARIAQGRGKDGKD